MRRVGVSGCHAVGGLACRAVVIISLLAWAILAGGCGSAGPAISHTPGRGEVSPTALATIAARSSTTAPVPTTAGPRPMSGGNTSFDGRRAYEHALAQCALGPRPTGSAAGRATGDYIIQTLRAYGWEVETQEFEYQGVPVRNVIGRQGRGAGGDVGILGAHYDTRRLADRDPGNPTQPVPGGNDGASGVAVLLELARVWSGADPSGGAAPSGPRPVGAEGSGRSLPWDVWLAFFDAEDNGHIDGWPWSVGAAHMAENLDVAPAWVIVVDMVGDAGQEFYYEHNSDPALMEQLWAIAADLGYADHFIPRYQWAITDDHIPFAQQGIPAVDIIDFDYPYWHTTQDTCDKVSAESLERVGRVLQRFVEGRSRP